MRTDKEKTRDFIFVVCIILFVVFGGCAACTQIAALFVEFIGATILLLSGY